METRESVSYCARACIEGAVTTKMGFDLVTDLVLPFLESPLFWWIVIISLLYLIERFDLGIHCFSWINKLKRHQNDGNTDCNGVHVSRVANGIHINPDHSKCRESKLKNGCTLNGHVRNGHIGNGPIRNRQMCSGHIIQNGHVPTVLNHFIRHSVIPTFRPHTKGTDPDFSVLVLSNISSVGEVKGVHFRQVTFNGRPLVDPALPVYPQSYRFENYMVARPSGCSHAETLIINNLRTLLKAYGVKERCYVRTPTPKFGLMYCWAMPCSKCVQLVVKRLSSICSQKFVLVYSNDNSEQWSTIQENQRMMKNAGILVAKIAPE